jgi:hypothetical protein
MGHCENYNKKVDLDCFNYMLMFFLYTFCSEPGKTEPVIDINNKTLLCPHEKFLYPLKYHDEIIELRPDEIKLVMFHIHNI